MIYDEPLKDGDLQHDPDGGLTLTVDASGMNDHRSRYRYSFHFTPDELGRMVRGEPKLRRARLMEIRGRVE